jgi:2-polyprenyl-3-methyl-5-hydroxy-6-metoxy-1,4-benzoquinol methylase
MIKKIARYIRDLLLSKKLAIGDNNAYPERQQKIRLLSRMSDQDLTLLNKMLPWASYILDDKGRAFGHAYSDSKRTDPQIIPDKRIVELDKRLPLRDLTVLELGCFEGHHTCTLSERAKRVIAIDSRIENVVKTVVRCAMFGYRPEVELLNLEEELPLDIDLKCDVLHHVGVLYHLTDPVKHLIELCAKTEQLIMLDTHVARPNGNLSTYQSGDKTYQYQSYNEPGREAPFAGMEDHAKWLLEDDLVDLLKRCGFDEIDVCERRDERNGLRILLYATRGNSKGNKHSIDG